MATSTWQFLSGMAVHDAWRRVVHGGVRPCVRGRAIYHGRTIIRRVGRPRFHHTRLGCVFNSFFVYI